MAQSAWSLAVSQGRSGAGLQGAPGTPGGGKIEQGNERAGYGQTGFGPPWAPNYPRPTTGGGYYVPPAPVSMPNPGDFNEFGNRWMASTGTWEPPNMFSDLNPVFDEGPRYPGGGGGGGGGGAPVAPAVPAVSLVPGGIAPIVPGANGYLELPEGWFGAVPDPYRNQVSDTVGNFLTGLGYQGLGQVGRYGERAYRPPENAANPYTFAPSLFGVIADPTLRAWTNWLFGEGGYATRISAPTPPVPATG